MIVGGGDFYGLGERDISEEIKKLAKDEKISKKIIFTGGVDNSQLPAFYSLADLLVVPSVTETIGEAWGLVLNEGMQFGTPVIATDAVGGSEDLVKDNFNGYIVPEKDPISLAKKILKILNDVKLIQKMKQNSKKIIKKFSYSDMVLGFEKAVK